MFVKISSCVNLGLDSEKVIVEADLAGRQKTNFIIVGLPDTAVQESKERVRQAVINSGFRFPRGKTIINLAPADIRKEGPAYDLPMAISVLAATEQLNGDFQDSLFIGELALNGDTRHINGILPSVIFAKKAGFKNIFLPQENLDEARLIGGINIFGINNLKQLHSHLINEKKLSPATKISVFEQEKILPQDMKHVQGQEQAKRALEIAASGTHNVLMSGPPGSGKTLLARTMPGILPDLNEEEIIEVTKIYSVAGILPQDQPIISLRPFRAPHHTSSGVSLVGGGNFPKPGEISLAHRGILFLDEFAEFPRAVLENLRQPLEDGIISISRAQGTLTFPARFTLVAGMNPCPCGYSSDPEKDCTCSPHQIIKYQQKISGPILDRIDLHVEVPRIGFDKLQGETENESSAEIKKRVVKAHEIQKQRFLSLPIQYNSEMGPQEIKKYCHLNQASATLLRQAVDNLHLSARGAHRVLKLARTIADLAEKQDIQTEHLAEALQFRSKNT